MRTILILSLISLLGCKAHKSQTKLEAEASEYAKREGGNVRAVNCVTLDSDGDHYVTCAIFRGDNTREEILCTIDADENGCKAK